MTRRVRGFGTIFETIYSYITELKLEKAVLDPKCLIIVDCT